MQTLHEEQELESPLFGRFTQRPTLVVETGPRGEGRNVSLCVYEN